MPSSQSLPTSQVAWQLMSPTAPSEDYLKLKQTAPVPGLKANQTLVRVLAASLNPVDYQIPELGAIARLFLDWPHTPGLDYVGRVWSTTLPANTGIKPGDLVFGNNESAVKHGSLGQFVVVSGAHGVNKVPDLAGTNIVDVENFAALGVAAITAYQALIPALGQCEGEGRGKSVFINGGSGGVGTFCIQIAKKILQCGDVVVTCSGSNAELCKQLGADEVIDYRTENVVEALKAWSERKGKTFDLAIDNVLSDATLYWPCGEYLRKGANYVQIGGTPNLKTFALVTKILLWPSWLGGGARKFKLVMLKNNPQSAVDMGKWFQEGKIKVMVDSIFLMEDVPKAFARLKTGRTRGKILVRVNEDGRDSY